VAELVAGKAQHRKATRLEAALQRLQPRVLRGEAALAGHIDHQQGLARVVAQAAA
jgi:hypothetical protein